jgi:hypothetical protein
MTDCSSQHLSASAIVRIQFLYSDIPTRLRWLAPTHQKANEPCKLLVANPAASAHHSTASHHFHAAAVIPAARNKRDEKVFIS